MRYRPMDRDPDDGRLGRFIPDGGQRTSMPSEVLDRLMAEKGETPTPTDG